MASVLGNSELRSLFGSDLTLPLLVAPMFLISTPELVIESRRAGVIGSIPTLNARSPAILDAWFGQIEEWSSERALIPYAANLIAHNTNTRFDDDLNVIVNHRVPMVISSVGSPSKAIEAVHRYGGLLFSDAASIKHARRSAEAGADGLILLCAGAGGHTGWLNPFAFISETRAFFQGPIIVAGGLSAGYELHALAAVGADLGAMGTRFIAATESAAVEGHRQMLIDGGADDVQLTDKLTGLPANMLRRSLDQVEALGADEACDFSIASKMASISAWRDVWSAGHGVAAVTASLPAHEIITQLKHEYRSSPA